jgi:hypothetical protein
VAVGVSVRLAATALLDAAEAASGLKGRVVAGEAALDSCCEDNGWALVVSTEGFQPVAGFPTDWGPQRGGAGSVACAPDLGVQMHVLLARCVPTLDDSGRAPDPRDEQAAHLDLLDKAEAVWRAISRRTPLMIVGEAAPFTVQGGCGWIDLPVKVDPDEFCDPLPAGN